MVRLSILICHNPKEAWRVPLLNSLRNSLYFQCAGQLDDEGVQVVVMSGHASIGSKRNALLDKANGQYVAFVDDDDEVAPNYLKELMRGIDSGADCCSLKGIIDDRGAEKVFIHSLKYKAYADNGTFYERYPNHLNCMRADIAKQFRFPEINHGEDTDWATQIHNSGLLKTEYWIDDVMYYYNPSSNRK